MNENLIRGIIYLRTSPSGKYYVGQTCNEEEDKKIGWIKTEIILVDW